jgi:hypothetical protein
MAMRLQSHSCFGLATVVSLFASCLPAAAQSCISHRTEGQTIILQNTCNEFVSWSMCLNVADRSFKDYPVGVIAPRGYSQYGVYSNAGFSYKYNWCKGASCQPAQPTCTPAPRQPNANIQKFIQGFTSAYTAARGTYKPAAPTFQPVAPAAPRNPSRSAAGSGASCSSNAWYQSCIRGEQLCMNVDPRDWSRIDPTSCCVRNLAQQFNVHCVP